MSELHDWLVTQHPGLRTYKSFRDKVLQRAAADTDHRALYRLLSDLAGHYVARYDGEPVPVDVAMKAYRCLLETVADAEASLAAPLDQQLATLNRIAATELF